MSVYLIVGIVVGSITLYVILCYFFGYLTGPNIPLWYEIFTFPLTLVLYPLLYYRGKKEDEAIKKWVEEYYKDKAKSTNNRGE